MSALSTTSAWAGAAIRAHRAQRFGWALFLVLALGAAGCDGGEVEPDVKYTYKPVLLPVQLVVTPAGIKLEGDRSIVTPIGTFSIGAKYLLPPTPPSAIYVIIRNRRSKFDKIFTVVGTGDKVTAVVNGRTTIEVTRQRVLIDVTGGKLTRVAFQRQERTAVAPAGPTWFTRHRDMWNQGWRESWYRPYAMTRAVYDDSTIGEGYGLGFVWFAARLAVAVPLAIVDTVLAFFFLVGQVGYFFFGATARNVVYGLAVLTAVLIVRIFR